ncbi:flagellar biosynthesis protein FlhA [Achromobacter insolitus]|jgi:flagellar biosynthesis protein FlhA|uniref:Flagellar biosynthesis protein FlhA n=1 Tax=Achromobacter insolitus TaxID=217204 RepID=A0A6S7F4D1_9BURK|nr:MULTISPECIES: flagellar biosynthesis protein FlhA [Achromobacter]GLK93999.1 flagellar biosynthesis protein FlhA [Achromobacter xylosoxidans]APX74105.1 flagellar biosynthesis protein FlhA [Achromobacter insolitus]AVG38952.1 flagellar biosynthesis protein FlhA [Achromobacter insolitus]AXA69635.1 flagellar biosynthesis protein FlhA [Achromobacter insolitus]MCP1403773.1 flagellar biosynthesis protein FlhA [Achromobacter insolitus]
MSALLTMLKSSGATHARLLAGPILIVMVLGMMVLPLPTFLLDLLFTFNIALSVMILLVAMFTRKPLDFAAFPAVLLFATLLRLSLNVASTRVVLLHGHTGPDAAGKVIEAFGHFLVGGNFAVGIIVFVILTIINFIVITKGAGRIAEVGARFTLDAMPGKQMAIDADLNAGLIGEDEARKRRAEVSQESDFFGSMDGASKFVRGDAIAGLLIMAINIIGGLIVGVAQHDMSMSDSARVYTLLTIGDGLVAQIPALVISTAAGVVVSRVSTDQDIGQQILSQLFSNPSVLFLTAGIVGIMGLIPNMPHVAFLTLAGALGWGGWMLHKRQSAAAAAAAEVPPQAITQAQAAAAEASWDDVSMVDQLGLEVGYRLIPLVDHAQNGELLHRIRSLRKKFAQDVGFLPPVVHIRDNLELKPNDYRILLSGVEVGHGVAMPGQWLAIDPGGVTMQIKGTPTTDPAFGLPALWIDGSLRDQAQVAGYTVVDAGTVVATHLNHLMHRHGSNLLGRQEVQQLLDRIGRDAPKLVEDLVPKTLSLTALQKVLQGLLSEEVPIRDMRTIIDTLSEHGPRLAALAAGSGSQPDINELIALTRRSLGRAITQQWFPGEGELRVIGLDVKLERVLSQAMTTSGGLEPGLADTLLRETQAAVERQESQGNAPVLLVSPVLRAPLSRFLRHHLPQLGVLSNTEIPDERMVRVTALIGGGNGA